MDVALVSVIATSAVAVAAVVFQGLSGRGQRKHESQLAYEQRVWDKKSEALFQCIGAAREAADALANVIPNLGSSPEGSSMADRMRRLQWEASRYGPSVSVAESISNLRMRLAESGPVIEAFGSTQVRSDLLSLRAIMRHAYYEDVWLTEISDLRKEKVRLIDGQDFDGAAKARDKEKLALKGMTDTLTIPDALDAALLKFIESARLSIRSD